MNFTIESVDPEKVNQRASKKITLATSVELEVYDIVQLFSQNYGINVSEYLRGLILADIESKTDLDEELKRGLLEGFRESSGYEVSREKGTWIYLEEVEYDVEDGEVCRRK